MLLNVERGTIQQATIYTDMLDPLPIERFAEALHGLQYHPGSNIVSFQPGNSGVVSMPCYQPGKRDSRAVWGRAKITNS